MDEIIALPPFLPLFIGGFMLVFLPRNGQRAVLLTASLLSLASLFSLNPESIFAVNILGTSVQFLASQEYSLAFGLAFTLAMLATALFGLKHAKPKEMAAVMVLASGGLGTVFAGDLISLFFFWEVMMCASVYLIYIGGTKHSEAASWRYLLMHILGGTLLLAGIAGTIMDSGIAAFPSYQVAWGWPQSAQEWSASLMLLGVMVNLAAPPFSAWLPDSYPAASPFGMIALSTFTTKSALCILMQLFAGSEPLIAIGLCMLIYGVVMALMQNHLRRHLMYCLLAQMGVLIAAVGVGSEAALTGAAILAFCHIGYNGLLTSGAGSIIRQTGKFRLGDLGGLWHQMPVTSGAIILGAISMAALPVTGAFIGKHMIGDAIGAIENPIYHSLFIGGTAIGIYMLFPWFALSGKNTAEKTREVGLEIQFCYAIFAFMAVSPGLYPGFLSHLIPHRPAVTGYDLTGVLSQLCMIACAIGAFMAMLPWLKRRKGIVLDLDWLYRVLVPHGLHLLNQLYHLLESRVHMAFELARKKTNHLAEKLFSESGLLTRAQSLGLSVAITTGVLLLFLVLFARS